MFSLPLEELRLAGLGYTTARSELVIAPLGSHLLISSRRGDVPYWNADSAFTMPQPYWLSGDRARVAVYFRSLIISFAPLNDGIACIRSATVPAISGVAIEVPSALR